VARTLADLAGAETIAPEHVLLAASLREDVL
jgi:predicted ATPase with chaperone activity